MSNISIINLEDKSVVSFSFIIDKKLVPVSKNIIPEKISKVNINFSFSSYFASCYFSINKSLLASIFKDYENIQNQNVGVYVRVHSELDYKQKPLEFKGVIISQELQSVNNDEIYYITAIDYISYYLDNQTKTNDLRAFVYDNINSKHITPVEAIVNIFNHINTCSESEYNIKYIITRKQEYEGELADDSGTNNFSQEYIDLNEKYIDEYEPNQLHMGIDQQESIYRLLQRDPGVNDNLQPIQYIQLYCRLHNIKIYRPNPLTVYIVRNLKITNLTNYSDINHIVFTDNGDKFKSNFVESYKYSVDNSKLARLEYEITGNGGGTKTTDHETNVIQFEKYVRLNKNVDLQNNWSSEKIKITGNESNHNACTLFYDAVRDYTNQQILNIYCNGFLDLHAGNLIETHLMLDSQFVDDQLKENIMLNGVWIVKDVFFTKMCDKAVMFRYVLSRYGIPKDTSNITNVKKVTESTNLEENALDITKHAESNAQDIANSVISIADNSFNYNINTKAYNFETYNFVKNLLSGISNSNNAVDLINDIIGSFSNGVDIYNIINQIRTPLFQLNNYLSSVKNSINSISNSFNNISSLRNTLKYNFVRNIKNNVLSDIKSFSLPKFTGYSSSYLKKEIDSTNTTIKNLNNILTKWNYTTTNSTLDRYKDTNYIINSDTKHTDSSTDMLNAHNTDGIKVTNSTSQNIGTLTNNSGMQSSNNSNVSKTSNSSNSSNGSNTLKTSNVSNSLNVSKTVSVSNLITKTKYNKNVNQISDSNKKELEERLKAQLEEKINNLIKTEGIVKNKVVSK